MKKKPKKREQTPALFSGDTSGSFRLLFENSSAGQSITGIDGTLHVNKSFCDLLGYTGEEMQTSNWKQITHPDDLERVVTGIHRAIDSGLDYWNDQYRFARKDLQYEDIEDRGFIVRDLNNNPTRMIGAMRMVTERKRAEEKLKGSLALLKIGENTAKLGGWSVNLKDNRVYWSDKVTEIHGMPSGYSPKVEKPVNFKEFIEAIKLLGGFRALINERPLK